MEFVISKPKMVRMPRNESKYIDLNPDLKHDHRFWPWTWPSPRILKVKYGICYISAKNGLIATKRKANISIELQVSNVTIGFDLGHALDLEFSRVKYGICYIATKSVLIAMQQKANISNELKASNVTIGFDLGHDLDLEFSRSILEFVIFQPKMIWLARNEK